jgi:hypothetical protein
MNERAYNFGPSQPVYTQIFRDGKVKKILEDEGAARQPGRVTTAVAG